LLRGGELNQEERELLGTACAAIDPRHTSTIDAPDEAMLVGDVHVLAELLDAARAN
jgi:hypothetical protein